MAIPHQLSSQAIDSQLTTLQHAFRQVRTLILGRAGKDAHTSKTDGSPVTETDTAVEASIKTEFTKAHPNTPMYGEEAGYSEDLTGTYWLIDPIDGTTSFLQNIPAFTCMAALIQNGEAVASIIYNPSLDTMYTAKKGQGTYKNGERLRLGHIPLAKIAHCKGQFIEPLDIILEPKQIVCESGIGGGGFDFTLVAQGLSAARFNLLSRGYIHDYAPGALLVREAGGAIIPVQETVYTYKTRSFIVCHPELEPLVTSRLQQIRQLEAGASSKRVGWAVFTS